MVSLKQLEVRTTNPGQTFTTQSQVTVRCEWCG